MVKEEDGLNQKTNELPDATTIEQVKERLKGRKSIYSHEVLEKLRKTRDSSLDYHGNPEGDLDPNS